MVIQEFPAFSCLVASLIFQAEVTLFLEGCHPVTEQDGGPRVPKVALLQQASLAQKLLVGLIENLSDLAIPSFSSLWC